MASAFDVVTANLAAYNARDLEAFVASFDPAIEVHDLIAGTVVMRGDRRGPRALWRAVHGEPGAVLADLAALGAR